MASPAQILANRANAQLSTGPRTSIGKAASAQNSHKHGLSSPHFALMPNEDPAQFAELLAGNGVLHDLLVRRCGRSEVGSVDHLKTTPLQKWNP